MKKYEITNKRPCLLLNVTTADEKSIRKFLFTNFKYNI